MGRFDAVRSGFDIELLLGGNVFRNLFQLLMDHEAIPVQLQLGSLPFTLTLAAADPDLVVRTYSAAPGADYLLTDPLAWQTTIHDFPTDSEHVYLSVRVIGSAAGVAPFGLDIFVRIRRDIDVRDEMRQFQAFIDGSAGSYDLLALVRVARVVAAGTAWQPNDHESPPDVFPGISDDLNAILEAVPVLTRDGGAADLAEFVAAQTKDLTLGLLDRLVLDPMPEIGRLGCHLNLVLLETDRGFVGNRGNISRAVDFAQEGDDAALATSEGFLSHLVTDVVIKSVLQAQIDAEMIVEEDVPEMLLGEHFPLRIPGALLGQEHDTLEFYVNSVSLETTEHKQTDPAGIDQSAPSLKLTLTLDTSLGGLLGLANNNLVIFLTPLVWSELGRPILDMAYETNLRANMLRAFPNPISLLASPFAALALRGSMESGTLSALNVHALSRLQTASIRWDPFYTSQHLLMLELLEFLFESERLVYRCHVYLGKSFTAYDSVYQRAVIGSVPDAIQEVVYHVNRAGDIVGTTSYATDRLTASPYLDPEPDLYVLPIELGSDSVRERILSDKLAMRIPFRPYCTHRDEDRITSITMLSHQEEEEVTAALEFAWLKTEVDRIVAAFAAAGSPIDEDLYDEIFAEMSDYLRGTLEFATYRAEQLPADFVAATRARLRLTLSPVGLNRLQQLRCIDMPRYAPVVRQGELYYRNVANSTEKDNLLTLPRC